MGTTIVEPTAVHRNLRPILWMAAYTAASVLGRTFVEGSSDMAIIWPAVAIGFLWLATSPSTRARQVDVLLMVIAGAAARVILGERTVDVVLAQITTVECVVAALAVRRLLPDVWGGGGHRMMRQPAEFARLLLAFALSAVLGGLLRGAFELLDHDGASWLVVPERIGRDTAALVGIGTVGVLVGGWLTERRSIPGDRRPSTAWTGGRIANAMAVTLLTGVVFVYGFWLRPEAPSATFVLTLLTVWVAIVFDPLAVAGYCLAAGSAGVVLTALDQGPIAGLTDDALRAILTQVFVVVLMVIGMTVSLTRARLLDAIDRLQRSEEERGARVDELGLLVEHLSDGVAIVERGGRIVHTNTKLRQIVTEGGMDSAAELKDGTVIRGFVVYGRDGAAVPVTDRPSMRALRGEVVTGEEYLLTQDPNGTVVQISAVPLPHAEGASPRAMVMIRDVTAEAQARETLVSFAGTVAHDLNNPLTVVDGWTETLEDLLSDAETVPTEAALPMLRRVRAGVATMRTFVSDLLAHAVARDQSLRGEKVDLGSVVGRVMVTRDRPGSPSAVRTEALPTVWGDRLLVQQLLDNLIGNALKYTRPGVPAEVSVVADPVGAGWTRVRICDNGIGIPEDQRDLVFRTFHRVDPASPGGTGLGLSICKRIVERHGGTIRALANPAGHGTCFELTLPTTQEAFEAASRNG